MFSMLDVRCWSGGQREKQKSEYSHLRARLAVEIEKEGLIKEVGVGT